jgi:hypothetical protein
LVTVAERVTDSPSSDGFGEEVRAVDVAIGEVTTCVTMLEVLVAKVPERPW